MSSKSFFFTKRGSHSISANRNHNISNIGGGSILLRKGGPGAGSSYGSLENRVETVGSGLKNLVHLRSLEMRPPSMSSTKPKNISF